MKISVTLDVADIDRLVRQELARRHPDWEVEGYTVMSWSTTVMEVEDDTMVYPARHRLDAGNRELQ